MGDTHARCGSGGGTVVIPEGNEWGDAGGGTSVILERAQQQYRIGVARRLRGRGWRRRR